MPFWTMRDRTRPVPVLAQVGSKAFELCNGFRYRHGRTDTVVTVPRDPDDRTYDLTSIPPALTWLIPTYGKHALAALLHDDLITHETSVADRAVADRVFRDTLGELDVPLLRRWLLWGGTAIATLFTATAMRKLRAVLWALVVVLGAVAFWASVLGVELPLVGDAGLIAPVVVMTVGALLLLPTHLSVGLLAVPTALYLLLPAAVIAAALAVYGIVEWVVKWIMRAVNRLRPQTALVVNPVLIRPEAPAEYRRFQCQPALRDALDARQATEGP